MSLMMNDWILPITILPAAGLIIMSTSNLSNGLSAEITSLLIKDKVSLESIIVKKIRQLRTLSLSLLCQYFAAAGFAVAGFLGGLAESGWHLPSPIVPGLLTLGILSLVMALILLTLYAFRAVTIKNEQFERQLRLKGRPMPGSEEVH